MTNETTAYDELVRIFGEESIADQSQIANTSSHSKPHYIISSSVESAPSLRPVGETLKRLGIPFRNLSENMIIINASDVNTPDGLAKLQTINTGAFDPLFGDVVKTAAEKSEREAGRVNTLNDLFPGTKWTTINAGSGRAVRTTEGVQNPAGAYYLMTEYFRDTGITAPSFPAPPANGSGRFTIPVEVFDCIVWHTTKGQNLVTGLKTHLAPKQQNISRAGTDRPRPGTEKGGESTD